jgi:hypothetical protein
VIKLRGKTAPERGDLLARARAARASRARGRGLVMIVIGLALVPIAAVIMFGIGFVQNLNSGHESNLVPVFGVGCLAAAGVLLVRGRRLRLKGADYVLAQDERPPIVYLRSFQADEQAVVTSWRSRRRVRPLRGSPTGLGIGAKRTFEERLARVLNDVAPFVTIGDPTGGLPHLGASRLYAGDDEWQETLDGLLDRGGAVILHIGATPGFDWEVEHVLARDEPQRLIVSLPFKSRKRPREQTYEAFRARFGEEFPAGLSERAGETQFLYFDADWTPHRLEEPGEVPAAPESGTPTEQRAVVLHKLAPEFKLMWGPLWARGLVYSVAAIVVFVAIVSLLPGGSTTERVLDVQKLARVIKPEFQSRLQRTYHTSLIEINSVRCHSANTRSAACVAYASDPAGDVRSYTIAFTLDPTTGRVTGSRLTGSRLVHNAP